MFLNTKFKLNSVLYHNFIKKKLYLKKMQIKFTLIAQNGNIVIKHNKIISPK